MPIILQSLPASLTTPPTTKRCLTPSSCDSDHEWEHVDIPIEISCEIRKDEPQHVYETQELEWDHHDQIIMDASTLEWDDDNNDIDMESMWSNDQYMKQALEYECGLDYWRMLSRMYNSPASTNRWHEPVHNQHVSSQQSIHQLRHGKHHYVYSKRYLTQARTQYESTSYHQYHSQRIRRTPLYDDGMIIQYKSHTGPMPRIQRDDHGMPIMSSPYIRERHHRTRAEEKQRHQQQMQAVAELQAKWAKEQEQPQPTNIIPKPCNNVTSHVDMSRWGRVLSQRQLTKQAITRHHTHTPTRQQCSAKPTHIKRSKSKHVRTKKQQHKTSSQFIPRPTSTAAQPKKQPKTIVPWCTSSASTDFDTFRRMFYEHHKQKIHDSLIDGHYGVALRLAPIGNAAQEKFMKAYRQQPQIPSVVYHGTSVDHMQSICDRGLLLPHEHRRGIANGSAYGIGIYTATCAHTSVGYCRAISTLFICAVLDQASPKDDKPRWIKPLNNFIVLFDSSLVIPLFLLDFVHQSYQPPNTTTTTTTTNAPTSVQPPYYSIKMVQNPWDVDLTRRISTRARSILCKWATRTRQRQQSRHAHPRYDAISCS